MHAHTMSRFLIPSDLISNYPNSALHYVQCFHTISYIKNYLLMTFYLIVVKIVHVTVEIHPGIAS